MTWAACGFWTSRARSRSAPGTSSCASSIEDSVAAGHNNILLNLEGVTHIDSSGIGEMVGCFTTVARKGGKMKLLNLTQKINDILQVTQLITVFDVYDNEAETRSELQVVAGPAIGLASRRPGLGRPGPGCRAGGGRARRGRLDRTRPSRRSRAGRDGASMF